MTKKDISKLYFEWLCDKVCKGRFPKDISYNKLMRLLHNTMFTYIIPRDSNRAEDGKCLRYRFSCDTGWAEPDKGLPCGVLEMIVALAIRCEETIMDDPLVGDRTGQWIWLMINNLGLGSMDDSKFDKGLAEDILARFLNREYEPDGRGGLFTIKRCEEDLRDVEIWYQLMWYLDSIR